MLLLLDCDLWQISHCSSLRSGWRLYEVGSGDSGSWARL